MKQKFKNHYATEMEELQNQDYRNFLEILGRWFLFRNIG